MQLIQFRHGGLGAPAVRRNAPPSKLRARGTQGAAPAAQTTPSATRDEAEAPTRSVPGGTTVRAEDDYVLVESDDESVVVF